MPPVEAIEAFVEKIGVDKFAWVPGYANKSTVPTDRAIDRIAWAIATHMAKVPTIKREGKGWYNPTVMQLLNTAKKQLREQTSQWIALKTKENLEE